MIISINSIPPLRKQVVDLCLEEIETNTQQKVQEVREKIAEAKAASRAKVDAQNAAIETLEKEGIRGEPLKAAQEVLEQMYFSEKEVRRGLARELPTLLSPIFKEEAARIDAVLADYKAECAKDKTRLPLVKRWF